MTGRTVAKAVKKKKEGSSTPGKSKGENCQASSISRTICKRNRSYKMSEYHAWCIKHNGTKGGGK